jgi:hypothetical protein
MPIETICAGCARKLRVADEHAGKKARCPNCGTIYSVPASPFAGEPDEPAKPSEPLSAPPPGKLPGEGANPFARDPGTPEVNPYASPADARSTSVATRSTRFRQAHRGGMILTLGILALCCNVCFIPGICAWAMGQSDLNAMNAGRMDPSGRGLTQAGMILGIIGTILAGLSAVVQVLAILAENA